MLHIHNGDSTAGMMKEAGFPGEHFAFREALAMGPTPDGLSKDEWISVRADYLADGNELDPDRVKRDLESLDAGLENISHHEETILWFEHDLFCQINLAYLLDRFSRAGTGRSKLSLICVGEFPGLPDFRGLGQLTPEQMGSLFETRHEVTAAEMELARKAWAAFRSPDPQSIERLLAEDTSALPFLHDALTQHLARFPSTRNGLGRAENLLLGLISDGHDNFSSLCVKFFNTAPSYGLGDSQIWSDLRRMADATSPLIQLTESPDPARASSRLHMLCSMTENGERVMAGKEDFVEVNGVDMWLGGVHLRQDNLWRWDEQKQRLLAAK
jgi:hypothetical protein